MMTSTSTIILAEHPGPIALSGSSVEVQLQVYEENKRQVSQYIRPSSRVFLHFHRIFGSPNSPNYDVSLVSRAKANKLHYIGALSYYSVKPKSSENEEGLNLKLKIEPPIKEWLLEEARHAGSINLLLTPQDHVEDHVSIDMEFVFLCCVQSNL